MSHKLRLLLHLLLLPLLTAKPAESAAAPDVACRVSEWRVDWRTVGDSLRLRLTPTVNGGGVPRQLLLLRRVKSATVGLGDGSRVRTDSYRLRPAAGNASAATATVVRALGGPRLAARIRLLCHRGRHFLDLAVRGVGARIVACRLKDDSDGGSGGALNAPPLTSQLAGGPGVSVLELRLDLDPSVWRHFSRRHRQRSGILAAATGYFGAVFAVVNRALAGVGVQVRWVLGRSRVYERSGAPGISYLRLFGKRVPAVQLLASMEALGDWAWAGNITGGRDFDHHMLVTRDRVLQAPGLHPKGARLIGLSFVGSACQPCSRSVVTDLYPAATARIIAHELGHVLGATDAPSNLGSEANYLMDGNQMRPPHLSRLSRLFAYSPASRRQIRAFVGSPGGACLRVLSNPAGRLWLPSGPVPSPAEQCGHRRGLSKGASGIATRPRVVSPPVTTRHLCRPILCDNGGLSGRILLLPGTGCAPGHKRCLDTMRCGRP